MEKKRGSIELITGAMCSGKTSSLLARIRRERIAKKECLLIKYAKDERYNTDGVVSHDGISAPAIRCGEILEIPEKYQNVDVIGIDEGQFFKNLVEFCENLANQGKTVIVAALESTFEREPFGQVLFLFVKAEKVHKLDAVCCLCHGPAAFTIRNSDEKEVEVIGGLEKYSPACRECHIQHMEKRKIKQEPEQQQPEQSSKKRKVSLD